MGPLFRTPLKKFKTGGFFFKTFGKKAFGLVGNPTLVVKTSNRRNGLLPEKPYPNWPEIYGEIGK